MSHSIPSLVQIIIFSAATTTGLFTFGQETEDKKPNSFSLTTRMHSTGHFPFGGVYVNNNLNMDFDFSLQAGKTGFFVFKAVDLVDARSSLNYSSVGISRVLTISDGLFIIPVAGYFFSQKSGFRGKDSDGWAALNIKKKISDKVYLLNSTMVGGFIAKEHTPSMANRLNINYTFSDFQIDAFVWYNQTLKQANGQVSASVGITTPKIVVNKYVAFKMHTAYQQFISSERPESAMRKGVLFSLIMVMKSGGA